MKDQIYNRLLWREFGARPRYSGVKAIYGDKNWIADLDIVNELGGHSGCVNALSWSTSGRLLASGSDDQHLNIHAYQPESSSSPFALTTTVATGHGANIFSVKFMPHSNDSTLVTCAGDAEVRVFDIEYSGRNADSPTAPNIASTARGQRFQNMYRGVRYLSDGNTNARVYRSHADRVKRIVTESSPNLFLTCSEDGEVRQFDLRMPSSAYPQPRGGRGFLAHRQDHDNSNVPPPLISYKRYNLDLNTISCSASQPHYIALGGAHLHCFLHDRRMLGRDTTNEAGEPDTVSPSSMSVDDEMMGNATRCVRRFAPDGRAKIRPSDNRHITACKISDANPNELLVSWSGDHLYSFDIIRSEDAREGKEHDPSNPSRGTRVGSKNTSKDRKRKRNNGKAPPTESKKRTSKSRSPGRSSVEGEQALRAVYEDGETEDIVMSDVVGNAHSAVVARARESVMTESQKRSLQIAKSSVKIRKLMFSLEASLHGNNGSLDPVVHRPSFTSTLGFAASCFPEMKQISGAWRYPVDPEEADVILQQTLRGNRNSAQRFVQAAGTLAWALGGRLQTASTSTSPTLKLFQNILPIQPEGPPLTKREVFSYTFLKAILLWLNGGLQSLLEGFKRPPDQRKNASSFPIPDDAGENAIYDILLPRLLQLAGDEPVISVDASRFERDETRHVFASETTAVRAFGQAIRMPFQESTKPVVLAEVPPEEEEDLPQAQDKRTALKYWGFKVGRSLLMKAGEGVDYQFVDIAFGGLGNASIDEDKSRQEIDVNEDDPIIKEATLITRKSGRNRSPRSISNEQSNPSEAADTTNEEVLDSNIRVDPEGQREANFDDGHGDENPGDSGEDDEESDNDDNDEDDDDDDDDEEDADADADGDTAVPYRPAFLRRRGGVKIEQNVPCYPHTRTYRGHCNVKTVKDANFFGLQDEYVVSGSDGGHVFIWNKRTSELVNILEGDGEVVNVIQGHPYEPLLAVSGIDHTIKIFSPDARAQDDARNGINISKSTHGSHGQSSLNPIGHRRRGGSNTESQDRGDGAMPHAEEGLTSKKRMQQSYQIVSQNDANRQGGVRDAYITRGMLAHFARRLRQRQTEGSGDTGDTGGVEGMILGEGGETILIDDNCTIM